MAKNIEKVLDRMEANLKLQQEKLQSLRENKSCIEYWDYDTKGGSWKPFTEKVASEVHDEYPLNLKDFRVNMWYLVKTCDGIRLLNKEEYATFMGETHILYQGSYQACKDFIKI